MKSSVSIFVATCFASFLFISSAANAEPQHAFSLHGTPKYQAGFAHFDYVDPNAPKGGALRLAVVGTFDSLNPFILKGQAAAGLGMVYETLMTSSEDEASVEYGLIAEKIDVADDRKAVTFFINKAARWHDGAPLTADDVVFSFETLMTKGHPAFKAYYADVAEVKKTGSHTVTFTFKTDTNKELPLILGQLPIIPKHIWSVTGADFGKTSLEKPLGSGPYRVKSVDAGKTIVLERVPDYWGKDLAVNKGRYNFDHISYDYYRDATVALEALFSDGYDFRAENIAKVWATGYDQQKAVKAGLIKKEVIPHQLPTGMQAFAFNTRRAVFADAKVREALGYAFDFEWSNKQFAYDAYKRTESYFSNSELASSGLPEGRELEILTAFKEQLPPRLFTEAFKVPKTSGNGRDMRAQLQKATALLREAGYTPDDKGRLMKDGKPLAFEILVDMPAFERWTNPFIQNLKRIGVEARLRVVDAAQYQNRMDSFDFDMTVHTFSQSLSPGNEQRDFWGSDKVKINGSRNIIGVSNPAIDQLVEMIVNAPDRQELIYRTRALDRVLLWNFYVIPQWHINSHRIAFWDRFGRPEINPKYGLPVETTWWFDAAKAQKITPAEAQDKAQVKVKEQE